VVGLTRRSCSLRRSAGLCQ